MENRNIGFIGAGKMGSALIEGIIKAGVAKPENIGASDVYVPFLDELKTKDNVDILLNSRVKSINGEKSVTSVTLDDGRELELDGVIINIGYNPITEPIKDILEPNQYGYIEVDWKCMTNLPGLFAAGDVVFNPYKQLVISASDGAKAAVGAYDYISTTK